MMRSGACGADQPTLRLSGQLVTRIVLTVFAKLASILYKMDIGVSRAII